MSWIGSVTGRQIDFQNPDASQVNLYDIARGLSNACRFAGQLEWHYSVAQHSVAVSRTMYGLSGGSRSAGLIGLLHDASEAYTGDVPKPLKLELGSVFKDIENRLMRTIFRKYGILEEACNDWDALLREADMRWCITERNAFQPLHCEWDNPAYDVDPYDCPRFPLVEGSELSFDPDRSFRLFVDEFCSLTSEVFDESMHATTS